MPNSIICVKIAQRALPMSEENENHFNYFPYDRIYIAEEQHAPLFKKMFRYYLSMPFTKELLATIHTLAVDKVSTSPQYRETQPERDTDETKKEWLSSVACTVAAEKSIMIVPTFVRSKYRSAEKVPYASELGYFLSKILSSQSHNIHAPMPRITFHTPDRTFPIMCTSCLNLAAFYANECTPGTYACRKNCNIELPLDDHAKVTAACAAGEVGGEVCP